MATASNENEPEMQYIVSWLLNQLSFLSFYYIYRLGYEKRMSDYGEYKQVEHLPVYPCSCNSCKCNSSLHE